MAVSPADFLAVAKSLMDVGTDEIFIRNAVSRAYYAALHTLDYTLPDNAVPSVSAGHRESTHQRVIGRAYLYGRANPFLPGRTHAAELARLLTKFRNMRNDADYALQMSIDIEEGRRSIKMAEKAFELCSELSRLRARAGL